MTGNSFGTIFRLTSFGASHGAIIGGVIEGCPAGIALDLKFIKAEMNRRRPGVIKYTSTRNEKDDVEFLSGITEGKTTGRKIKFAIKNKDVRSSDYSEIKDVFRPSHADFTCFHKYGISDFTGGGRSSARETAVRVAAGTIAKLFLKTYGITVNAYTSQIGEIRAKVKSTVDFRKTAKDPLYCPDARASNKMMMLLKASQEKGDTVGGIVNCVIQGCPIGLGEPVFDKLQADLAKAVLCIPAAKGFEYGEGFHAAEMSGSLHNDPFRMKHGEIRPVTNHAGGILGGISSGEDIFFRVAFKPISSIGIKQKTVDIQGKEKEIQISGRHDVCALPRAVPVVEAMAALTIADHLLRYLKRRKVCS